MTGLTFQEILNTRYGREGCQGGSKPIFRGTFRLCYRLYVQCKIDYLEVHIYKMEWKGSSFKMGGKKLMALGTLAWSHKVVGSTIPPRGDKVSNPLTCSMKLMRRMRVFVKVKRIEEVNLPKPSHILASGSIQWWTHPWSQPLWFLYHNIYGEQSAAVALNAWDAHLDG